MYISVQNSIAKHFKVRLYRVHGPLRQWIQSLHLHQDLPFRKHQLAKNVALGYCNSKKNKCSQFSLINSHSLLSGNATKDTRENKTSPSCLELPTSIDKPNYETGVNDTSLWWVRYKSNLYERTLALCRKPPRNEVITACSSGAFYTSKFKKFTESTFHY